METDLLALLVEAPAVSQLVGDRIDPSTFEQATGNPCIRYQRIGGALGLHMGGSDGLDDATVQLDIRGLTAASVLAVRDAIVTLLHGWHGNKGDTEFQQIALSSDRGVSFEKTDADKFYLASLDFDVWSRAAA